MNLVKIKNYGRRALQPRYWPELIRRVQRKLNRPATSSGKLNNALELCRAKASSTPSAMAALGYPENSFSRFLENDPQRYRDAVKRVTDSGARMGGGTFLDLLYSITLLEKPKRILETGVAYGWSSFAILEASRQCDGAQLTSIDLPYLNSSYDNSVGIAVPDDLRHRWTLVRGADRDCLEGALAKLGGLDFAHYDSDKSYDGRMWSYGRIYAALRPGGVLMSDDIQDNEAFFDFSRQQNLSAICVRATDEEKYIGLLRKPA